MTTRRPPPTALLHAFVAAARSGSFVKAAQQLNLSASAISHQIRKLEGWWGVVLFDRHARGVDLTTEGERLFPVVAGFFDDLDRALSEENKPAPLILVCTSSLCQNWLAPRLSRAAFDVVLHSHDLTLTTDEKFDLAIVMSNDIPTGYHSHLLMTDTVFPVCAPEILPCKDAPLLARADDGICPDWADSWAFRKENDTAQIKDARFSGPRFPDSSLTLRLAASGHGIALGRMALVFDALCQGTLVPTTAHAMPAPKPYQIIWSKDSRAVHGLVDWLLHEARLFVTQARERFPGLAHHVFKGLKGDCSETH